MVCSLYESIFEYSSQLIVSFLMLMDYFSVHNWTIDQKNVHPYRVWIVSFFFFISILKIRNFWSIIQIMFQMSRAFKKKDDEIFGWSKLIIPIISKIVEVWYVKYSAMYRSKERLFRSKFKSLNRRLCKITRNENVGNGSICNNWGYIPRNIRTQRYDLHISLNLNHQSHR